MDRLGELNAAGVPLDNMDDGASFTSIRDRVSSANAYYGAWPVVEALRGGAQIVVTGRCTDTGITLAPMIHAFGWAPDDWDRLASGIVAGHIVECGAQSTGGNFSDWRTVRDFAGIGYPVIEVSPDGSFVVTKHAGTGGAVTVRTVKEQLVYEMGDPRSYITPDVIADFASARLEQVGRDRVRVWGVQGRPAPASLKVSASYFDGWKASGSLIISAPRGGGEGGGVRQAVLEAAGRELRGLSHGAGRPFGVLGSARAGVGSAGGAAAAVGARSGQVQNRRVLEADPGRDPVRTAGRRGHRRTSAGAGGRGVLAGAGAARPREAEAGDARRRARAGLAHAAPADRVAAALAAPRVADGRRAAPSR